MSKPVTIDDDLEVDVGGLDDADDILETAEAEDGEFAVLDETADDFDADLTEIDGGQLEEVEDVAEELEEAVPEEILDESAIDGEELEEAADGEDVEDIGTGNIPALTGDTPIANFEDPPLLSAQQSGNDVMVEITGPNNEKMQVQLVLPAEFIENPEDFPEMFPSARRSTAFTGAASRRRSASGRRSEEELTPEQLEMRRRKDFHAKLIIYGIMAFVTLLFVALFTYKLPVLAKYVKKDIEPIWPWSVIFPRPVHFEAEPEEPQGPRSFNTPSASAEAEAEAESEEPAESEAAEEDAVEKTGEETDTAPAETEAADTEPAAEKTEKKLEETTKQLADDEW